MSKNKKKDDKATEGFTESSLPKNADGTLQMEAFYSYLPTGKYKEEMEKYTDLDVLFGKLKYNSFFNKGPEAEFLRGSYAEKKHTFQANQLKIVWGNDAEEDELNAYRVIILLILVRFSLMQHKSCEEVPAPAYIMTDIHGQFSYGTCAAVSRQLLSHCHNPTPLPPCARRVDSQQSSSLPPPTPPSPPLVHSQPERKPTKQTLLNLAKRTQQQQQQSAFDNRLRLERQQAQQTITQQSVQQAGTASVSQNVTLDEIVRKGIVIARLESGGGGGGGCCSTVSTVEL